MATENTPQQDAAKAALKNVIQAAEVFYDNHFEQQPTMEARRNAIAHAQAELLNSVSRWRKARDGMKEVKTS